jgi:GNAT superfamily N-acetyltransferase
MHRDFMNLTLSTRRLQTKHMTIGSPPLRPQNAPQRRNVQDADRDFLVELYRTTHRVSHEALSHLPQDAARALLAMQLHAQAASYRQRFPGVVFHIVCDHQGRPAGRLTVARTDTDLHLLDIGLLPEYRGQGLGTALIETLQREAAASGIPLQLKVMRGNRARQLYQRMGFVVSAEYELDLGMTWVPSMAVTTQSITSTRGA